MENLHQLVPGECRINNRRYRKQPENPAAFFCLNPKDPFEPAGFSAPNHRLLPIPGRQSADIYFQGILDFLQPISEWLFPALQKHPVKESLDSAPQPFFLLQIFRMGRLPAVVHHHTGLLHCPFNGPIGKEFHQKISGLPECKPQPAGTGLF